jgi:hypothetical protein
MVKTELTSPEREELIEQVARWATGLGIGALVVFLLECNRPVAPLTGNALIALGPMLGALPPIPLDSVGLLLMEDGVVDQLRRRVTELETSPLPAKPGAPPS